MTVRGRLERTFRQGAVGSFPPLVEAWVFSTSGDPFCVVYPQAGAGSSTGTGPSGVSAPGSSTDEHRGEARPASPAGPGPGRMVRFTGTFLKMVRYAAGDGDRLAPLIVGDRPPASPPPEAAGESTALPPRPVRCSAPSGAAAVDDGPAAVERGSWLRSSWMLGLMLAAVAAVAIAAQHLRGARLHDRAAALRPPPRAEPSRSTPSVHRFAGRRSRWVIPSGMIPATG